MKKYMVVEKFKPGCMQASMERYHSEGRLFPKGLCYLNSWVNAERNICFQLMESNDPSLFEQWFKRWEEYVEFELYPID